MFYVSDCTDTTDMSTWAANLQQWDQPIRELQIPSDTDCADITENTC